VLTLLFPVAFFLFATSAFVLVAMLSRGGWTLGRIITTSVMMPRVVTCPPALADWEPNAECKASKIVIFSTRINYGNKFMGRPPRPGVYSYYERTLRCPSYQLSHPFTTHALHAQVSLAT